MSQHFTLKNLYFILLPHYFGGIQVWGSFAFKQKNPRFSVDVFFPPHPPFFRYFKSQDPEKTFLLVPIVSYFKWKKYIMLNLNTKTLWMCKLQNSKPFSLCQCKPPKEQRIKYTLSSLTMIEHVPVLKSAEGSRSNTPKQSRAFSNEHEKKRDILIQISAQPFCSLLWKLSPCCFKPPPSQRHGAEKNKTYLS